MASGRGPYSHLADGEDLASLRNILRLKNGFIIAQAISDFPVTRKERPTLREFGDVCCPLPFTLQDLCLLVIVSDLDCHRIDVLASLPRWLRKRLLDALPALDLGRLERTPVADGINVDAIWKLRCKNPKSLTTSGLRRSGAYPTIFPTLGAARLTAFPSTAAVTLQMNICKGSEGISTSHKKIVEEEMTSALKSISHNKIPEGKDNLLTMASDIITGVPKIDLTAMIHKLISIDGDMSWCFLICCLVLCILSRVGGPLFVDRVHGRSKLLA